VLSTKYQAMIDRRKTIKTPRLEGNCGADEKRALKKSPSELLCGKKKGHERVLKEYKPANPYGEGRDYSVMNMSIERDILTGLGA